MKLMFLRGLPGSGKSYYAKQQVAESKGRIKRVNKDELRAMLSDSVFTSSNEKFVVEMERSIAREALNKGLDVIVDNTGFNPVHEDFYMDLAREYKASFDLIDFKTDVDTCIKRDLQRPNSVGERVIRKMWRENIAPVQERVSNDKPKACIFDIDGTLALKGDRTHYDYTKVSGDITNKPIIELSEMFGYMYYTILVVSGRDSVCREDTQNWLLNNGVHFTELHMRPTGDNRNDTIIKEEIYNTLKDKYDIRYAVDDRLRVCRMWHEKGLCLLKVGDPDLEF